MDTEDPLKLKPVYVREVTYSTDNEINLIDILLTLAKRKTLIIIVMTLVLILGITVAFLIQQKHTYSATIEIGNQLIGNTITPFETLSSVFIKLEYNHIPQTLDTFYKSHKDTGEKYKVISSAPNNSNTILLTVNGTESQANTITTLLEEIALKTTQNHQDIFLSLKESYEENIAKASAILTDIDSSSDNFSTQQEIIERNTNQLANLHNTKATVSPSKSIEPSGISRKTIILTTLILGIILSLFATYVAEVIVKIKLEKDRLVKKSN